MSSERDTTRLVRSWLEDGVTALPDRVLDAVLDQLPATHQRRTTWWAARRFPIMNNPIIRYGLAAAVVVAIALLGVRFLVPTNGVGPPAETPTPSPTPRPTVLAGQDAISGRYQVDPTLPMYVTAEVPSDGWSAGGAWILIGPRDNQPPDGMAIRFYVVGNLFNNPASYADGQLDPAVGPTAGDLMEAIVNQPAWESTEPADITIGGYPAKHVQVTIPADAEFDTSRAADGAFYLFEDARGGEVYGWAPGQVFDVYAVDVGDQRLVIDAYHYPATSTSDLATLQAVVDSIEIGATP